MHSRALVASLIVISVTLAAAATVFFVLFLNQSGKVHKLQKERTVLQRNLSAVQSLKTEAGQPLSQFETHSFISKLDGVLDSYTVSPPLLCDGSKDLILIVYLHGMRATSLEPFIEPKRAPLAATIQSHYPSLVVASCNYRPNCSWANAKAISDIDQNIHELLARYPITRIVLMGTSMGGCSSLAYSYLAAEDIKEKICGVVSSEGSGNWVELYQKTPSHLVQGGMVEGLGATAEAAPDIYQERSIELNLRKVKPGMRFALISAAEDTIIPPAMQKQLEEKLQAANFAVSLISVAEKHGVPPAQYYLQGLNFVLNQN